jgi:hypothetical protein
MIEDAEKNSLADKSKKSLVNITYELDNLLLKIEKLTTSSSFTNKDSEIYFEEVIKEIKDYYNGNKLEKISSKSLTELKYAYSIIVLDFLKSKLAKGTDSFGKKGTVIDVTEE